MNFFIGFLIAVAVGLTGIGGGSFTVPALILIVGLTSWIANGVISDKKPVRVIVEKH